MTRLCELDDEQLLVAWAGGDRDAGSELIERHFALVYRFFRSKVASELQDLVQQTFLSCVEARARYEGRSSFATFLLGIARNQLFNYYHARRREQIHVTPANVRDQRTSPTEALARRDQEGLLADALQRIPLDAQLILELAYWEGFDGEQIAAVLDVPLNTAYSRLRRAKQTLREKLQQSSADRADREHAWRLFEERSARLAAHARA